MAGRKTSDGPIGLGATFEVTGKMLFWKIRTTLKVIEWQAGRNFTIKTASSPVAAQKKYIFESVNEGTRLTLIDDTQYGGCSNSLSLFSRNTRGSDSKPI